MQSHSFYLTTILDSLEMTLFLVCQTLKVVSALHRPNSYVCFLVKRGGRKEAEGKRGVDFHEDSLAAVKRSIYVSD